MKKYRHSFSNKKGTVLFIVLIVIFMITMIVAISSIKMNAEIDFIGDEFSKLDAYIMCKSGYEFAENRILTSIKNRIEFLDSNKRRHKTRMLLNGDDISISLSDILQKKYKSRLSLNEKEIQKVSFTLNLQDSAGLINFFRIDKNVYIRALKDLSTINYDQLISFNGYSEPFANNHYKVQ